MHRLSGAPFETIEEAVGSLVAVQAQDFAGAKWALGLRTNKSDIEIDEAFAEGRIVRTHVLRPTWHFVLPRDLRWLLALTAPRICKTLALQDAKLGIDARLLAKAHEVMKRVLEREKYLTREEIAEHLAAKKIVVAGQALAHVVMYAELDGLICSGPRRGKQFTYALLENRIPPSTNVLSHDEALEALALRYFDGHGPATIADFAWWSGQTLTDAKEATKRLRAHLVESEICRATHYASVHAADVENDEHEPTSLRLLPAFDESLVAYEDRDAFFPPELATNLPRGNFWLSSSVIARDGKAVGTWRRTLVKGGVQVECSLFVKLGSGERKALDAAIAGYASFLGLPLRTNAH